MNNVVFDSDVISDNEKEKIINYLYLNVDISNHKFLKISKTEDIMDLKNKKYYVSANYGGITTFLIFLKIENNYNCFLIDRRSLTFDKNNKYKAFRYNDIRFKRINLSVDIKFYNGTIFDCIKIDDLLNGRMQIIILDVLHLFGNNMLQINYKKKMMMTSALMNKCYTVSKNDNAIMYMTPVYELDDIKTLFIDYIQVNIDKLKIKGIGFHPAISAQRMLYLTTMHDNKYKEMLYNNIEFNVVNSNEHVNEIVDKKGTKYYKISLVDLSYDKKIILNLEVIKTIIPDIYKLYSLFDINNKIIKKKIGCAHIPNYNTSLKCKNLFSNIDKMIMECEFNKKTTKFTPLNKAPEQKMHIINKHKKLSIVEYYE
jgi:hypothetical protein